jgi:hypothetical protein
VRAVKTTDAVVQGGLLVIGGESGLGAPRMVVSGRQAIARALPCSLMTNDGCFPELVLGLEESGEPYARIGDYLAFRLTTISAPLAAQPKPREPQGDRCSKRRTPGRASQLVRTALNIVRPGDVGSDRILARPLQEVRIMCSCGR